MQCAKEDLQVTKSKCEGSDVYADTTDIKNRKMLNVLVAPLSDVSEKPHLVKTKICISNSKFST